ncbi:MAG: hypothetical protein ACFFDT_19740, partial [Candidatus Hodarchaeota archaeon]
LRSTQEDEYLSNPNYVPSFSIDENHQEESYFLQNGSLSIRTYAIPQAKHGFLHFLVDVASNAFLSGYVSETFCILPLNQLSAKTLFQLVRFGEIRIQKRVVRIILEKNESKQEYIGILILAQVTVACELTNKPTKSQISEAVKKLKEETEVLTTVLKQNKIQIKRLTRKEQLNYLKGGEINIDHVVLFENVEQLELLLPKRRKVSTFSPQSTISELPIVKITEGSSNVFHRFFQLPIEKTALGKKTLTICQEVT